jgi:hypothetical protein
MKSPVEDAFYRAFLCALGRAQAWNAAADSGHRGVGHGCEAGSLIVLYSLRKVFICSVQSIQLLRDMRPNP